MLTGCPFDPDEFLCMDAPRPLILYNPSNRCGFSIFLPVFLDVTFLGKEIGNLEAFPEANAEGDYEARKD